MMGRNQWPSFFNLHPFDVISSFMHPMLDIVSPFMDRQMMSSGRQQPSWFNIGSSQRSFRPQRKLSQGSGVTKMPQKYRIVVACPNLSASSLKAQIKRSSGSEQSHLVVFGGKQFKRSFTLPKQVECNKMTKFVLPTGQLCVEFPFLEVPTSLDITLSPKIFKSPEGRIMSLCVPIPRFVDPSKVQLQTKGREIIVRFEQRCDSCECVSRVYFYNRVTLPDSVDMNSLKCKSDKHRLMITAPFSGVTGVAKLRVIPIQRKLRHRKVVGVQDEKMPRVSGNVMQEKKKGPVSPIPIPDKKAVTPNFPQKKRTVMKTPIEKLNPIYKIEKPIGGISNKPINIEKKKKSTKKTTSDASSGGLTGYLGEKGSEILKKVFGTGEPEPKRTESPPLGTTEPKTSGFVGETLSGFQHSDSQPELKQ